MDAVTYIKEYKRMCEYFDSKENPARACEDCPLEWLPGGCHMINIADNAEECVAAVERWSKEHPAKTRQSEFLKMFPNAPIKECGIIDICPNMLGELIDGAVGTRCCIHVADGMSCDDCARDFWLAEIKDGEA